MCCNFFYKSANIRIINKESGRRNYEKVQNHMVWSEIYRITASSLGHLKWANAKQMMVHWNPSYLLSDKIPDTTTRDVDVTDRIKSEKYHRKRWRKNTQLNRLEHKNI